MTQLPPAGWYPDPENAVQVRWWDGTAWAPAGVPRPPVPVPVPVPVSGWAAPGSWPGTPMAVEPRPTPGLRSLGRILAVAIAVNSLVALVWAAVDLWGISMVEDAVLSGDETMLSAFDVARGLCGFGILASFAVTVMLWLVWQYRLASAVPSGWLERTPGFHVGSWFIPFANLVFPVQNLRSLWRIYLPDRARTLVGWWWAVWLGTGLFSQIALTSVPTVDSPATFRQAIWPEVFGQLAVVVAGLLAIRLVMALVRAAATREGSGWQSAAPAFAGSALPNLRG